MLHNITKPRPWRGRVQIRCEQEWEEHWQVDTAEQVTYDNLWGRKIVAGFGGSASTHEVRGVYKVDKKLQGEHRGWSSWLSSQSAVGSRQ